MKRNGIIMKLWDIVETAVGSVIGFVVVVYIAIAYRIDKLVERRKKGGKR